MILWWVLLPVAVAWFAAGFCIGHLVCQDRHEKQRAERELDLWRNQPLT